MKTAMVTGGSQTTKRVASFPRMERLPNLEIYPRGPTSQLPTHAVHSE